jgi:hypothetical protein
MAASAFTSGEIYKMNKCDKYLADFMKASQLDWLVQDVMIQKTNIDMDTMYSLFTEAYNYSKDGNSIKILEIMKHLYNLEIIDDKFYIMIVNLLYDDDFNQIRVVIDGFLFSL